MTEVCHSCCKEVTGVSLTFGSKCGPLQSSWVIFLVLLDLSSWDFYDDINIVIIEALIWVQCCFFFPFLSLISSQITMRSEERERKREKVLKTQQSFYYENINAIKKILTRQNQWPIMIRVGYNCCQRQVRLL